MGRFIVFIGVLLIGLAIAYMGLIFSPNVVPAVADVMVDVFCEPPETQITTGTRMNTGGTVNSSSVYFCDDNEGNQREISGQVATAAAIGFIVLLLSGIVMLMGGLGRLARNSMTAMGLDDVQIVRGADGLTRAQISPEQQEIIQNVFSTIGVAAGGNTTLSERLQQLEDARNQGLISTAEYERTRQAILESMDDM